MLYVKLYKKKLNTDKNYSKMLKTSTNSIIGYNWDCFSDNTQNIKDHLVGISDLKYENSQNCKNLKKHMPSRFKQYIAEALFGSYAEQMNSDKITETDWQKYLNKIEIRHNTILYFVKNGIISPKKNEEYWIDMLRHF